MIIIYDESAGRHLTFIALQADLYLTLFSLRTVQFILQISSLGTAIRPMSHLRSKSLLRKNDKYGSFLLITEMLSLAF